MPTAKTQIKFKYGLQENYTKLTAKDANTLYFATDTQRLFVGDVEYTRPVITGTSAPTMDSPLNTLFYNTSTKTLYTNTADGWLTVATNFSLSTTGVTAGAYGDTTAKTPAHGGSFKVPSFTVDTFGRLTLAGDHSVTLPAETQLSKGKATTGKATQLKHGDEFTVETDVSVSGHAVTPEKTTFTLPTETTLSKGTATTGTAQAPAHGKSFTVITDVNVSGHTVTPEKTTITLPSETAETPVSIGTSKTDKATATHGGTIKAITSLTASGHTVTPTVTTITLPSVGEAASREVDTTVTADSTNLPTSNAVNEAINTAISGVTQFDIQVVASFDKLPTTGKKGVIYLVPDTHDDSTDIYDEYIWNTAAETPTYEKIGNTDVNLSAYAKTADVNTALSKKVDKTITVNGHALSADVTVTKADVGLGKVENTADSAKNVATAKTLATARTIGISGAVTGTATSFDGSADISIVTTAVDGATVTGTVEKAKSATIATSATTAGSATKATQDGEGNVITTTYATKEEVSNASLVWESF